MLKRKYYIFEENGVKVYNSLKKHEKSMRLSDSECLYLCKNYRRIRFLSRITFKMHRVAKKVAKTVEKLQTFNIRFFSMSHTSEENVKKFKMMYFIKTYNILT